MSFTTTNISAFVDNLKRLSGVLLSPQSVDLYGAGTVTVKLYVGRRRGTSSDLTGGADQENQICTIDAEDWDRVSGRIPQKGDVIHWAGRRFAVEDCQIIAPEGAAAAFYKCRLRG